MSGHEGELVFVLCILLCLGGSHVLCDDGGHAPLMVVTVLLIELLELRG